MKIKDIFQIIGNGIQYCIAISQIEDVLRITGIILSVIISILIIVDKIITWWKKAHADGIITEDELKEGVNIIKEGAEDIKEHIESKDNGNRTNSK